VREVWNPPVVVSGADERGGYPSVIGLASPSEGERPLLRVGDRILELEEADLRGVGTVGFIVAAAGQTKPEREARVVFEREGERREGMLRMRSYGEYWPRLPTSLLFALTAIILVLRARPSPMVRAIVLTYYCTGLVFAVTFVGGPFVTWASLGVHLVALTLGPPLALRGAILFPDERVPTSALGNAWPWAFAPIGLLDVSRVYGFPLARDAGAIANAAWTLLFLAGLLVVMTRAYRLTDRIGRRQMKWLLFGVYCGVAPVAVTAAAATVEPRFANVLAFSGSAVGLIPLALLVSILRYNLLDIDRILGATASYTIIGIVLLAGLLAGAPPLARAMSEPIGLEVSMVQLILSVALAALVVPAQRLLRPGIDRTLFPESHALMTGMTQLVEELTGCRDPGSLTRLVGERLDGLVQPESCVIYTRGADAYRPLFVRGRPIPPVFHVGSPLVAALAEHSTPLASERFTEKHPERELGPFDRAALETLGVPIVVPFRRGHDLVAFLCLGPKRSGDVYTSTDLALLSGVTAGVAARLASFDQEEIIREGIAMQAALRRYVPEALAQRITSGGDLESGRREVTVLFVDMRGYTSYAEGRPVEEVFSTVNLYTETVSKIVRTHFGTIAEFTGDGMMAVFGAPEPVEARERAAVAAGLEIVRSVGTWEQPGQAPRGPLPPLGVGIATGEAYVGNVQTVDRLIWTAIGRTTNLAARLQTLTRELDAALAMDETTWKRCGEAARLFLPRTNVRVRGHAGFEDVYVLPLDRVGRAG
jgi:class 3 adenylate cyclase